MLRNVVKAYLLCLGYRYFKSIKSDIDILTSIKSDIGLLKSFKCPAFVINRIADPFPNVALKKFTNDNMNIYKYY